MDSTDHLWFLRFSFGQKNRDKFSPLRFRSLLSRPEACVFVLQPLPALSALLIQEKPFPSARCGLDYSAIASKPQLEERLLWPTYRTSLRLNPFGSHESAVVPSVNSAILLTTASRNVRGLHNTYTE